MMAAMMPAIMPKPPEPPEPPPRECCMADARVVARGCVLADMAAWVKRVETSKRRQSFAGTRLGRDGKVIGASNSKDLNAARMPRQGPVDWRRL
jgi:hypothetical protein